VVIHNQEGGALIPFCPRPSCSLWKGEKERGNMQASIGEIVDKQQWSQILNQAPYSWHGHSIEYQQLIELNDPRHCQWKNYLLSINGEDYLIPCEIINGVIFSHEKYYAGLIPVKDRNYIDSAIDAIKSIAKQMGKSLILSYLETDEMFSHIKSRVFQLCQNANWKDASIMNVDKEYPEIWKSVYDDKARNMIRKSRRALEFGQINILEHVKDAVDCTNSKPIRHGTMMPEYYRSMPLFQRRQAKIAEILGNQAISFGAFYEGKLVAYINTIRSYHEAIISNLLSNADYWHLAPNNGLFDFMIQWYCKDMGINQLMYSFDGVDGVDKFKKSMGFNPVKVMRCVFGK
jgi:hypothetical protein